MIVNDDHGGGGDGDDDGGGKTGVIMVNMQGSPQSVLEWYNALLFSPSPRTRNFGANTHFRSIDETDPT